MELKNYINEILDIACENNMSWDIGADMFLANIRNAGVDGLPYYPGADQVDYMALGTALEAMTDEALAAEKNAFADYVRTNLPAIIQARQSKKGEQ